MKPRVFAWMRPGFLLFILFLTSVAANAARLEADRNSIAVGDVTTVHLLGTPFIAVVDWKVGPELEILDSDKNHARVRGLKAGVGVVNCDMNLSSHSIEITVRDPVPTARPAHAPPATYSAAAPPPPASPPPIHAPVSASTSPALRPDLAGTWRIDAAGALGKLELSSTGGMLVGRAWFNAHGVWEPLEELYFDKGIGELSFTRPGAQQAYRGRLRDDKLEGRFIQGDGRGYSASSPMYAWTATRSDAGALPTPSRIASLVWQGLDEDRVGEWGNGRPNGTPDGHFLLSLELPQRTTLASISLWSANPSGDKAGGHIWHTANGGNWMLGVFRDGRQLNASHIASLGEFSGEVALDLYANSSGLFNPGQHFLLEVATGDGQVLTRALQLENTVIPARIETFSWQGLDEDRIGEWGNGRPNGTPDGHFRLALELPDHQPVTSISVWSATDKGDKAGGQVWHSRNGGNWMLGVFRDGRQLNASHVASLGQFSGQVVLDLYANSSGWFNPGQTFLVEVETDAGKVLSRTVKVGSSRIDPASLRLERDRFTAGEAIVVHFTAPEGYAGNAWIGIIPSAVAHGSEAENDRHDLSYQYMKKLTAGSMTFIAPKAPGDYDLRMHDSDNNGREVASVRFRVDAEGR